MLVWFGLAGMGGALALMLYQSAPHEEDGPSFGDEFAAGLGGLLWGSLAGFAAALVFVLMPAPQRWRIRLAVLGGLFAWAFLWTWLAERVD